MRVSIHVEDNDDGDNWEFQIPILISKDCVNTLHDLAYLYEVSARAMGFHGIEGVAIFGSNGDLANSTDLGNINFSRG
jgi:hypothetical protein